MALNFHQICVAGTHSGVGKTTLVLGLMAALRQRGLEVQPFKCGPDYIDAGHHTRACAQPTRNLDSWIMGEAGIRGSYARAVQEADTAVIEGVMGLFDGAFANSAEGSTAHIAQLLDLPIVLVVDARGMARSIAAMVQGYARFMPGLNLVGIVANKVAGQRHTRILKEALAAAKGPPLLGALPRDSHWEMPERHMGLIPATEHPAEEIWLRALGQNVAEHVDMDRLLNLTCGKRPHPPLTQAKSDHIRLAVARDAAFHFYYEDNLDALRELGAKLVEFSPLEDTRLPEKVDGVYIGGGFPEMFAERLEANAAMRENLADFAAKGGCIFAECGGFMYLCRSLTDAAGKTWRMCGVLDAATRMHQRRVRLSYVQARTQAPGIFGPAGTRLRGHEFHWSSLIDEQKTWPPVFEARDARGWNRRTTGLRHNNVWASYVHVHFAANPEVARNWLQYLKNLKTT